MTVNFNLARPAADVSPIRLVITHRGKVYRKSIGLSVRTARWNARRQLSGDLAADRRLNEIRSGFEERLDALSTDAEVRAAIAAVLGVPEKEEGGGAPGMWEWLERWSRRPCASMRFRRVSVEKARRLMERDGGRWEDVDRAWAWRLSERLDAEGVSANYKASVTARLRTGMKAAYDSGETSCQAYRELHLKWVTADTTYLTRDEVDTLWGAPLEGRDAMARDLFILGVYTAARFQNYSALTEDNIHDGLIEFVQPKTGGRVLLPVSPRVSEVLARHGGAAPKMAQQELNRRIKEICRGLGMDGRVEVVSKRGGRTEVTGRMKWEMVSAHTARRTGATLLYLSGVPTRQCMMLTGHTTEENFRKYIRVTKEENARMLADNPFFK
jgi:integrase